jgi:hypothetical protein
MLDATAGCLSPQPFVGAASSRQESFPVPCSADAVAEVDKGATYRMSPSTIPRPMFVCFYSTMTADLASFAAVAGESPIGASMLLISWVGVGDFD